MSYENFKDVRFEDFSGGLNTKYEDNKIGDNQSPDLSNIDFDGRNSFTPRKGIELFGSSSTSTGSIRSAHVYTRYDGVEVPMRSQTTFMQYYNTETADWETLDSGFTSGQIFGYADYYDQVYYCNVSESMYRWNGLFGRVSGIVSATDTVVRVSTSNSLSALGWLSAGSAVVDGYELYYTALSSNALSTVTWGATFVSAASQRAIAQLPLSSGFTSAPKGNIMLVNAARLFVAGASAVSSDIVYYSKVDDPTDFTISAAAAFGGTVRYPEGKGPITSLVTIPNNDDTIGVIKKGTQRGLQIRLNEDGTEGVIRPHILTSPDIGAVNHLGTALAGNDVLFVSPKGRVRKLGSIENFEGRRDENLAVAIEPTLSNFGVLSAASMYNDGKYYLGVADDGSTFNDVTFVYDTRYQGWTRYAGINAGCWFIYGNDLYVNASNEIATYKINTGYDDNDIAYQAYWSSKKIDYGIPNEMKRCRFIYVEGYIHQLCQVSASVFYDDNSNAFLTKVIEGNASYVDTQDTITIGDSTWGSTAFGNGEVTSYTLNKFRVRLSMAGGNFFNMQIKFDSYINGTPFKITHIAPYVERATGEVFPISSII